MHSCFSEVTTGPGVVAEHQSTGKSAAASGTARSEPSNSITQAFAQLKLP